MTTTAPAESKRRRGRPEAGVEGTPASRPAAAPPTKSRRRPALILAGVALAIVGGLGSWWYASSIGNTVTVLVTSTAVTRGEQIETADLTTLEIAGGQASDAITAARSTEVVGQVATVDLPAGSLITSDNIGGGLTVESGQSIVGVALTAAQMPSHPLAAGDAVRIVDTPIAQGDPPQTTPQSYEATVFTSKYDDATSQWIVDLVVPQGRAADIAARSATGRIALVLDGGQ